MSQANIEDIRDCYENRSRNPRRQRCHDQW
jgi:hypothetical protein